MTVVYKPSEIMKKFDLKESLYKKYIAALEKEGYIFQKNQHGHRFFTNEDIETLENFLDLIRYDGMTIDSVAKKIGEMKSHDVMTLVEKVVTVALETQEKHLTARFLQQQEQLNQIETRVKERDQLLMQSIRESQEVKKLLLEMKEQIAAAKEEKKKSWWQFWK